ncbi:MAG: SDR family oxidoreductase [Deltaproteobacteria bacterium]|nr:SDR family oxidoreductase [Deltaproteobacteria bacterium]
MDINGKVAVVTGGGSGIGRATAIRLAQAGARVVVVDLDERGAGETAARIAQAGAAAAAFGADVARPAEVAAMLDFAGGRFGGLDILHNNAGITTGDPGYPEAGLEQWQRVIDINLRAVILATQLALPLLRRRGGGAVVHTSSLAGLVGWAPDPIYAATKAAVVLFTQSLAPLAAENIRINCICPGGVNTPMLQRARQSAREKPPAELPLLEPEEVADGVLQLISDDTLAGRTLVIAPGLRDFAPLPPLPS